MTVHMHRTPYQLLKNLKFINKINSSICVNILSKHVTCRVDRKRLHSCFVTAADMHLLPISWVIQCVNIQCGSLRFDTQSRQT